MIYTAYDIGNHRFWCIVDATNLAHFGIVLGKKCLVKVDNRVLLPCALAEVPEDGLHVTAIQYLCQIVYCPDNSLIQVWTGDIVEHLAQEWVRFGYFVGSMLTGKVSPCFDITASSEQAIANGLSIHVSELFMV